MEANGRTGQVMSESSDSCWFLLLVASTSSDDVGLVGAMNRGIRLSGVVTSGLL